MPAKRIRPIFFGHNIPCPQRCGRFFINEAGVKSHLHIHRQQDRARAHYEPQAVDDVPQQPPTPPAPTSPHTFNNNTYGNNKPDAHANSSDDFEESDWECQPRILTSRSLSPELSKNSLCAALEEITYHPTINGRPCDQQGQFIPHQSPPPPWDDPAPDDFSPYESREHFELAELLYKCNQMSRTNISDLMQILAHMQEDQDADPLFVNVDELYATIDATELGDVAWESFTVSYNGIIEEENDVPWKNASYDIWFRNPLQVLKNQLSNCNFAKEMDFTPKKVFDKNGKRCYQDLMSGQWAWRQADIVAQDTENHGATLCPVILGSDKMTVSIATGQNDYYPLYLSNGLIHNNVQRAHWNGRGFKQWTGNDSKALMKVYLATISGLVPPRMVRAVRYLIEFCYLVCRSVLDDDDLDMLEELLAQFHEARKILEEQGVRPTGFNLPQQHSITHYRHQIIEFGAPNGLCMSITESKHISAVKDPYRRSSRNEPLGEILIINQCMEKLAATRTEFTAHGLFDHSSFRGHREAPPSILERIRKILDDKDDEGGAIDSRDILGEVLMSRKSGEQA
ncbi:hypothetical protein M378DRAFT_8424 [Amanita muscaria Koide BX008]|uniref:C2H2-type domain-containing protein n=1 Tax=Amanita muscaria (strain Koide BX008) TaxID=946122 RepID=A0A0C2XHT9_AMAMK|nr:hypothetical protein M378DRAFT_8424 [Amanita muscaria Koide BX008]